MRSRPLLIAVLAASLLASARTSWAAEQLSDTALGDQVAAKIRDYVHFTIFDDVNIAVADRVVTLTGRVTMPFKRNDIGERVAKIDGIRALTNDIQVLPVSQQDADLRLRVAQAIYGHPSFWRYASMACPPIHIVVEGGRITLTGRVDGEAERTLAYALAQVPGAFAVKNELKLDR